MALLSWSPQYSIGNDQIDAEHAELFRLVNAFDDHWREKRDPQSIAVLLNQLIAYAEMHFQHEEAIMRDRAVNRDEARAVLVERLAERERLRHRLVADAQAGPDVSEAFRVAVLEADEAGRVFVGFPFPDVVLR